MVTDAQVRLLRQKRMEAKTQEAAAAAAGMSVRTARSWETGPLPSERKRKRTWRTRVDPFDGVWTREVVALLEADTEGVLEAKTLLEELERRHPGEYGPQRLRTLQRRIRDWRAPQGPAKEVCFEQRPVAGREGAVDFTHAAELGVTIAGEVFMHLLFQFVLSFSKWRWVQVALGETFEALVRGVQGALWSLEGVPEVLRSDNLSAATHELPEGGRSLTRRFSAVLTHYGLKSTRIEPGESHQNGVVEKAHDLLKGVLAQELLLRGSREFPTVADYEAFVAEVVERKFNRQVSAALAQERTALRSLPSSRVPEYTTYEAVVRKWSTIHVGKKSYSVPSRLIGHTVEARVGADEVEVYYQSKLVERMPRLRGGQDHRIDYRHVIWSLVRKPGAFARYRYREDLFPSLVFRRAYDALRDSRGDRADIEYVRVLHLAASTMQSQVEGALEVLLAEGRCVDYVTVRALAAPETPKVPPVFIGEPNLRAYDALLSAGGAS